MKVRTKDTHSIKALQDQPQPGGHIRGRGRWAGHDTVTKAQGERGGGGRKRRSRNVRNRKKIMMRDARKTANTNIL